MSEWDPQDIDQDELHRLRNAAEQAWGDDTRHPNYEGHPQPSAGQCWVTSRWMQKRLGGYVGVKRGHYFWVSPDKSHVIDLTGDQFAYGPADLRYLGMKLDENDDGWTPTEDQRRWRPGPVLYKPASHRLYKGLRVVPAEKYEDDGTHIGQRVNLFAQRADEAYNG